MTPLSTPEGLYPLDTRTGILEIDVVLEAVAKEDIGLLKSLVDLTEVPCTTQTGIPSRPPCPEGVGEGTPITAFPNWGCGPSYHFSLEAAQQFFDNIAYRFPLYVYAVYRSPRSIEGVRSIAYEIMLAESLEDGSANTIFLDVEGRIIRADSGCNIPSTMIPEGADFILPPLSR